MLTMHITHTPRCHDVPLVTDRFAFSLPRRYQDMYNNPIKATNLEHRDVVLDILSDARVVGPLLQTGTFHADVNRRNYMYVFGHNSATGPYAHVSISQTVEWPLQLLAMRFCAFNLNAGGRAVTKPSMNSHLMSFCDELDFSQSPKNRNLLCLSNNGTIMLKSLWHWVREWCPSLG